MDEKLKYQSYLEKIIFQKSLSLTWTYGQPKIYSQNNFLNWISSKLWSQTFCKFIEISFSQSIEYFFFIVCNKFPNKIPKTEDLWRIKQGISKEKEGILISFLNFCQCFIVNQLRDSVWLRFSTNFFSDYLKKTLLLKKKTIYFLMYLSTQSV